MPERAHKMRRLRRRGATGALRYSLAWLLAGVVATLAAIALIPGDQDRRRAEEALPPIRDIALLDAVRRSRCRLRRASPRSPPAPAGPRKAAAAPGTYRHPLSGASIAGAVQRGVVVIQHHRVLAAARLRQLAQLQRVVPRGTIVAPYGGRDGDALVVAAFERVLRCPAATDTALDAVRLFSGRYLGSPGR